MIRVDIYDVKMFACFFDVISSVGDCDKDILLNFKEEGLRVDILNRSHTQFFNALFDSAFFDEYSIPSPEEIVVDSYEFFNIIDSARKGESLAIEITDDTIKYLFGCWGGRVIETPLSSGDSAVAVPPSIDYRNRVEFQLSDLKPVLTDLDKLVNSSECFLKIKDNDFFITSTGKSMMDYQNRVQGANIEGDNCQSKYNVKFLLGLCKFKDVDNDITMKLGDDMPLSWAVNSPDNLVECKGLIAPLIGEE